MDFNERLDELLHHLPSVVGALVGSYIAVRRHFKVQAKRLKAVEDGMAKLDPSFKPATENVTIEDKLVGILAGGDENK